MPNVYTEGTDAGYIFSGPSVEEKRKAVKKGTILIDNHRTGVVFSNNPESPWYHSTFYSQGSIVKDSEGSIIKEVALCETTDADGDLTWSILWQLAEGQACFISQWEQGNGKVSPAKARSWAWYEVVLMITSCPNTKYSGELTRRIPGKSNPLSGKEHTR